MSSENLPFEDDGEMVCHCFGVSAFKIKQLVYEKGLDTVEQINAETGAGMGCQSCRWRIAELIDEVYALRK